ncbi:uncharacterized protein HKW66_Vig0143810 [Vigna angularis]|uniref:Uncharacterized protein n=1 Tax=Phaseolus angularis TaxID=3914 RepID=A0A8T0KFZ7_PHAAN|nr:uncharacterized protein HKW66_Vig0143810 [Vigna angularis]
MLFLPPRAKRAFFFLLHELSSSSTTQTGTLLPCLDLPFFVLPTQPRVLRLARTTNLKGSLKMRQRRDGGARARWPLCLFPVSKWVDEELIFFLFVTIIKENVLPDFIMAIDWVADGLSNLVPPPGSALRVSFLKLKEGATGDEVLGVVRGLPENFKQISELSFGENFVRESRVGGRPTDRLSCFALLAVFAGPTELEAVDRPTELLCFALQSHTPLLPRFGFEPRQNSTLFASVQNRGKKPKLFVSHVYASVAEPLRITENNRCRFPLLH